MNHSFRCFDFRFYECFLLVGVMLLFAGTASFTNAQAPSTLQLQLTIDKVQKATESIEEFVDSGTVGQLKSQVFERQTEKLAIDRRISDLGSLQSKIESLTSKTASLKRDWESAQQKFKQRQRDNEKELEKINQQLKSNSALQKTLNGKWDIYDSDFKKHDASSKAYNRARIIFEARKGTANDPEYSRLLKWYNDVESWRKRIVAKRSDLDAEQKKISSKGSELNSRWTLIFNDANLLKERLAMEKKERMYSDQNRKLVMEKRKMSTMKESIEAQIQNEIRTLNGMLAGIERAQTAVREATAKERTFYSRDIPLDNVKAVQLAPGRAVNESPSSTQGNVYLVPRGSSGKKDRALIDRIRAGAAVKKLQSFKKVDLDKKSAQVKNFPSADSTKLAWTRFPIRSSFSETADPSPIPGLSMDVELDTRKYFSKHEADRAKKEIIRLKKVIGLLNDKIDELRSWRKDLNKYREEVAKLHRKTVQNDLGNLLNIAQIGKVAEKLSKMRDYENAVNPKLVEAIKEVDRQLVQSVKDAESFLKAYDSQTKSNQSEDEKKQIVHSLESVCSLLDVSIQRLPKGDRARKYLEGAQNIYQAGLKVIGHEENSGNENEARAERIFTTVEIMAVFYPPAAVGLGIGNEINDYRLRKNYIKPAAESLRYGLSKNWDAERSLIRKIQRTQIFIDQHQRVVSSFDSLTKDEPEKE